MITHMLFTDLEVRIEKNFAQCLECTDRGRRPWSVRSRPSAKFFFITDRCRPVNNITRNTISAVTREARVKENTESRKSDVGEGAV